MSQQAESVGIAVEMRKVVPLSRSEAVTVRRRIRLKPGAVSFLKIADDSPFTGMPERRIAQVVSQTGRRNNTAERLEHPFGHLGMKFAKLTRRIIAQRAPHAGNLQTVRQPVVHENTSGQREYLRLVLKATKRGREDKPIVIALELRAQFGMSLVAVLLTQTFVGDKLFPIHIEVQRKSKKRA